MADVRVEKMAKILVDYSLKIKAGDLVVIRGETNAEPLIREVYKLLCRRGAYPHLNLTIPEQGALYMKEMVEEGLDFVSPLRLNEVETADAELTLMSPSNTQELSGIEPSRLARLAKARTPISEAFMRRALSDTPSMRWCGTLYPVSNMAQDAHMSLSDYEDFVYHAMMVDTQDPSAAWEELAARQAGYVEYLGQHDTIRVVGPDTDISMKTAGRRWVSADGHLNFPDGEVFTGPIEESVNGTIRYTFPTVFMGREAEDVQLWFENGQVTRWEAKRGKPLLDHLLNMDEGARRLGEFAIGTNYAVPVFTKSILFDEKIGGTCHLAVGRSIPLSGGVNQSDLHWDMVCDLRPGGEISADGEVFHRDGKWLI